MTWGGTHPYANLLCRFLSLPSDEVGEIGAMFVICGCPTGQILHGELVNLWNDGDERTCLLVNIVTYLC